MKLAACTIILSSTFVMLCSFSFPHNIYSRQIPSHQKWRENHKNVSVLFCLGLGNSFKKTMDRWIQYGWCTGSGEFQSFLALQDSFFLFRERTAWVKADVCCLFTTLTVFISLFFLIDHHHHPIKK